jgi:hypothetical protein
MTLGIAKDVPQPDAASHPWTGPEEELQKEASFRAINWYS